MPYIMRLFLAGLIAFVPSPDGKGVQVLLIDAGQRLPVGHCASPAHTPLLAVHKESVVSPECGECGAVKNIAGEFCVWELKNVAVQIHGFKDQEFKRIEGVRGFNFMVRHQVPEKSSEGSDISWLADMKEISSRAGLGVPTNGGLTARLEVRSGSIETCHLVEMGYLELLRVPTFEFRQFGVPGSKSRFTQALTDEVKVETSMESEFLTIYRKPFDSSATSLPPINLKAEANGHLDIIIVNVPLPKYAQDSDCEDIDVDFVRYFSLLGLQEKQFLPHRSNDARPISVEPQGCGDDILIDFFKDEGGRPFAHVKRKSKECAESVYTRPICAMATFPQ